MDKFSKIIIVVVLVGAVALVFALKQNKSSPQTDPVTQNVVPNSTAKPVVQNEVNQKDQQAPATKPAVPNEVNQLNQQIPAKVLPKLLDLGSVSCIPCKMMAPILEELKNEYKGRVDVIFVDVWQDDTLAKKYGIQAIPTQIFFDASGKEVYRHVGFFPKEDIIKKFAEMGVK